MPSIYLTENLYHKALNISPWRYIGSDQNDDPSYLGSSVSLKQDIDRLGRENFSKIILEQFDDIDNKELRKLESKKYLQPNNVKKDSSYYNKSELYAPGGKTKGCKHTKPRSEQHIQKIIEHRTGSIKNESARQKMREKKLGHKASETTRKLMSEQRKGDKNINALSWTIITPEGIELNIKGLRKWARDNNYRYRDIYYSLNGWISVKHGTGSSSGKKRNKKEM